MIDLTRRPVRTLGGTLLLVVAVLLSVIGLAPPSHAVDNAHITGTVTGIGGAAVDGVVVKLYSFDEGSGTWGNVSGTTTVADGTYDLGPLPANTYRVDFTDFSGTYTYEAYDDAADVDSGTDIPVGEDEVVPGIDSTLSTPASIGGTVTNGTDPLEGIYVTAYDATGNAFSSASTGPDGGYTITGLPGGSYRLGFTDFSNVYDAEYWDDQPSLDVANEFAVAASQVVTGKDAVLEVPASVSGTVTDGTDPLEGIYVSVYDAAGSFVTSASTGADGGYTVPGLSAGSYRLGFTDFGGSFLSEFWDDQPTLAAADAFDVAASEDVTGKDAALATPAAIAGTVTDGTDPLEGISVTAYVVSELGNDSVGFATTTADGAYEIPGLEPGTYRLGFEDGTGNHLAEFWDDQPTLEAADDIVLAQSQHVSGKDAVLASAGSIAGTVTAGGSPVSGGYVTAYLDGEWSGFASTDTDGTYALTGLVPGSYQVRFEDADGDFLTEFWNDKPTLDTADLVVVSAGTRVDAIDADLGTPATITGTVTSAEGGGGLEGINVTAYAANGPDFDYAGSAQTGPEGGYELTGLAPGTYKVAFEDYSGAHLTEYWNDKASLQAADAVSAAAGATVPAIDAELATPSSIGGHVSNGAAADLADISVVLYRSYGFGYDDIDQTGTDVNGDYNFPTVEPGTYRIGFRDDAGEYAREYWEDAATLDEADDIVVGVSQDLTADGVLAPASRFQGTVTGPGGAPLADITVRAYEYDDGWTQVSSASTAADGAYQVRGLSPGVYRLGFSDPSDGFAPEYFDNVSRLRKATNLQIGQSQVVTGKDAQLAAAGAISGTVTAEGGGPLQHVDVTAYEVVDGDMSWTSSVATNASGVYTLAGLRPGDYRLEFSDDSGNYLPEAWDDAPNVYIGDTVVVAPGATTAGRDAVLTAAGHLTGTVTGPGGPVPGVDVTAYELQPDGSFDYASEDSTTASGQYDVGSLGAGTFRLRFSHHAYVREFWNDQQTLQDATDVVLGASATVPGLDAVLAPRGSISGHVAGTSGPLTDVQVSAYLVTGDSALFADSTETNASGDYTITDLGPGTYKLRFSDFSDAYLAEYYDDVATLAAATTVDLTSGEAETGKDATLAPSGGITGLVTGPAGGPLEDTQVTVYEQVGDDFFYVNDAYTNATGHYTVAGLSTGTYRVQFSPMSGDLLREYYDGADDLANANNVAVTAGTTTPGIDAQLASASFITGTVTTAAGGAPIENAFITAYRLEDGLYSEAGYADTQSDGSYRISGLGAGTYKLEFARTGFRVEYWDDKTSLGAADEIVVAADATVAGKNAALTAGPGISGTVTGPGGIPAPGVQVSAYRLELGSFQWFDSTDARADGSYVLRNLPEGSYKLRFEDGADGVLATEYFDNVTTLADATVIDLAAGTGLLTGKNAELALGGTLTGTVTAPSGDGLSDVWVTAYRQVGEDFVDVAGSSSRTTGYYVVEGLPAGTYKLGFDYFGPEGHWQEFYDGAGSMAGATPLTLTNGQTRSHLDVGLAPPTNLVNDVLPSITGTTQVGQTLTADPGEWTPSGATFAYQWLADDELISGATASTYVLTSGELGKTITVRVTASKEGFDPDQATSDGVGPVTGPPLVNDTPPSISGTAQVGSTLTADPGTWTPSGATFVYQWMADDADIGDATGTTYVVQPADLGKVITVQVVASKAGFAPAQAFSAGTSPVVNPTVVNTALPSISGTPKVGQALTATGGTWNPSDVTLGYQWRAGADDISGATGTTYTPVDGDVGKTITVRVIATRSGYNQAVATSAGVGPVIPADAPPVVNLTPPSITGTPQVGELLTASGGTWDPSDAALAYQWRAGPDDISGATGTTYTPVEGDVGKTITVRVTASKSGFGPATETSAGVGPVTAAPLPEVSNVTLPTVTGTPKVGSPLTATPGAWNPADVTPAYQWLVNGSPVSGATAATFVPGAAQVGQTVSVRVTASKTGHTSGVATSAPTATVAKGTILNKTLPKISGKAKVGKTLTASPGTWAPSGVRITYQWLLNGKVIKKATKNKLKLTAGMRGKRLSVRVTASAPGYVSKVVVSAQSKKVL